MAANIDPDIPELVSLKDIADMHVVSRQAVLKAITSGRVLARRVGGAWVVRREVAEALSFSEAGKHPTG